MWSWRRMENIKWLTKKEHIGRKRKFLLNYILYKKVNWIGHIPRRNYLLHDAIEGQMMEIRKNNTAH